MFPSSHPQSHPNSTAPNHPRQFKPLDNAYPQPQPPNRKPLAMKKNPGSGFAPTPPKNNPTPTCANCATQTTPLWRRNQSGETLCNACALFQKMKGRPRPISLKTNVIKPRNRTKAIDRIPLAPSYNQQPAARSNDNLVNINYQANSMINNNNKNNHNQNYPPTNPSNLKSNPIITPFPHSFESCPSLNSFHSPTSKTHLLDPNHLTPIHPSGRSHSPSSSQHSFCSARSAPQAQSLPPQLIRSGSSGRKSSPGGVSNYPDIPDTISSSHDPKRRKYLSDHVLNKSDLYERRTSTGSLELLHQQHRLPLRASSHARITPTLPFDTTPASRGSEPHCSDHKTSSPNHLPHQFRHNVLPSDPSFHYHASAEETTQNPPPPSVSGMSSSHQILASMDCASATQQSEQRHVANLTSNHRGRSNLRPSRITLPPLSQITKDLVPACQLNPSPINFGPPLSFEASAREARLNSPSSSQHLLTIPSSTYQRKIENRRAVSVISSASDSESVISPARTTSSSSRVDSPRNVSNFRFNNRSPITPPVNNEGFMPQSHCSSTNYSHENSSSGRNGSTGLDENLDGHQTEENGADTEVNRLKNRILQLELINGVMGNRINELENHHPKQRSQGNLSEASDHLASSGARHEERRCSFAMIDDDCSASDEQRWIGENESEEEDVNIEEDVEFIEDQEDEIDDNACVEDHVETHFA